jgi:type VI secretion system protein ImpC
MSLSGHNPASPYRNSFRIPVVQDGAPVELPFLIGVLGDFSGMPEEPLPHLRRRRFVHVDLSNLDDVLQGCRVRLAFDVQNRLTDDDTRLKISLRFQKMADFSPEAVARQIEPLSKLLELRARLAELRASLQSKDGLDRLLQDTINDEQKLKQVGLEITADTQLAPPHKPTEPEPTPTPSVGVLRPNRTDDTSQAHAAQPAAIQVAAVARANWTKGPASAPEPGVWSTARGTEGRSILDQLTEVRSTRTPPENERRREGIKQFLSEVLQGNITPSRDTEAMIGSRIAQIDHLVSLQLNEVLHHAEFQRLEASWRGLHFLLKRVRKASHIEVRLLNASKKEVLVQFQRERERYTSPLARKLLDEAFGTNGATPFSLLVGAFEVGKSPEEVELLERLARLCVAAHLPFIAAASPALLGVESFTELSYTEMLLRRAFESSEYWKWNSFRSRVDSRYVGLVLPGLMMRLPYGRCSHPVEAFDYEERVDGSDHTKFLWGNAAWALAARLALDFERDGWCGAPHEPEDRGEIRDLPVFEFRTDDGDTASRGPAEIAIGEKLYLDLRSLGLIPLCQIAETGSASFYESWSCHKPKIDPDADPPTTYESAQLDCMLDVSRVAHCLHAILRDACRNLGSPQECEEHLRKWIAPYVAPDYARGTSFEAAFPLLAADFRILGAPDWRGKSKLEASLLPKRPGAPLTGPVEIAIEIALPWGLAENASPEHPTIRSPASMAPIPTLPFNSGSCPGSGRDQFIRRMLMAESCVANRKLDVAMMILEDLAQQIDRYHLDEWESPHLVTHVWDSLRRCHLLASPSPEAAEHAVALLRRICRLDPSRAIE